MKKRIAVLVACAMVALLAAMLMPAFGQASGSITINYEDKTLNSNGSTDSGNFEDVWDISAGDLVLSATVDLNGIQDTDPASGPPYPWDCGDHAWSVLGVRTVGSPNFNPTYGSEGKGVWLATDHDEYWKQVSPGVWAPWPMDTFAADPVGAPTLEMDDKLILQKGGGLDEGSYNLPSTPPAKGSNHRVWFDRDGVDKWQANPTSWPLSVDGGTYNTKGRYDVVITMHADSATSGTAYMTINGLDQGFEVDGIWKTMELTPAGMTFSGDMKQMQVYYALFGYGAAHSVTFENITATGVLVPTINWDNPADIVYGTPLSDTQLNATATAGGSTVPGTFAYSPAGGEVLSAGSHTLHVDFTPEDDSSYTNAKKDVTINVTPKAASVTPAAKSKIYGETDPTLTGTLEGFLDADNVTATYSREAGEAVGTYKISAALAPENVLANYDITYNTADLTIGKADTTVAVTSSDNCVCWILGLFGKKVTFTATVSPVAPGAGTPDGAVTFYSTVCRKKIALGTATLDASGKTSLSVPIKSLCLFKNSITAEYSGSANFNASTSPVLTQYVW